MFNTLLPSQGHSPRALLSCYGWRMNKVANMKFHRWICSHCLWKK